MPTEKSQARTGGETTPERFLDRHLGNIVHFFLSLLAILLAGVAALAGLVVIRFYFIQPKEPQKGIK